MVEGDDEEKEDRTKDVRNRIKRPTFQLSTLGEKIKSSAQPLHTLYVVKGIRLSNLEI